MLDVQRFRQYVTEEQSRQEEHSIPTVLTGSGVDQEPPTSSSTNGQVTTSGEEDSVPLQDGHGTDQVFAHGRVLAEQDSSSQPPSFLSQESSRTVIAGGPTVVKPGTAYQNSPCYPHGKCVKDRMENMHIYLMVWFIGGQDLGYLGQNWKTRWLAMFSSFQIL